MEANQEQLNIVSEYALLACRQELSELEAKRMSNILEIAQEDDVLCLLINEVDYFICSELNLLDEDNLHYYQNQKARIKEFIDAKLEPQVVIQSPPYLVESAKQKQTSQEVIFNSDHSHKKKFVKPKQLVALGGIALALTATLSTFIGQYSNFANLDTSAPDQSQPKDKDETSGKIDLDVPSKEESDFSNHDFPTENNKPPPSLYEEKKNDAFNNSEYFIASEINTNLERVTIKGSEPGQSQLEIKYSQADFFDTSLALSKSSSPSDRSSFLAAESNYKSGGMNINSALFTTGSAAFFADGVEFSALSESPQISSAPPLGIKFGHSANSILHQAQDEFTNEAGEKEFGTRLEPGRTLGLLGGSITFQEGTAKAPGGDEIGIGSVAPHSFVQPIVDGSNFYFVYEGVQNFSNNGTLALSHDNTKSNIIEPPFDDLDKDGNSLDIASNSRSYSLELRKPLIHDIVEETGKFNFGIDFSLQESNSSTNQEILFDNNIVRGSNREDIAFAHVGTRTPSNSTGSGSRGDLGFRPVGVPAPSNSTGSNSLGNIESTAIDYSIDNSLSLVTNRDYAIYVSKINGSGMNNGNIPFESGSDIQVTSIDAQGSNSGAGGSINIDVAQSLDNLALVYLSQERYQEAESLYLQSLEMRKIHLASEHSDLAQSFDNLASLYDSQGQRKQAKSFYLIALELRKKSLGRNYPDIAQNLHNYLELESHNSVEASQSESMLKIPSIGNPEPHSDNAGR